ncbi:MAG: ATP-dependent protease LonB [Candidatus Thermoplasmatota archaeon]
MSRKLFKVSATPAKAKVSTKGKAKEPASNGHGLKLSDPHAWIEAEGLASTADLPLPELLIDEVIGQEEAVEVAKKAARQRRHLLLLGDPGTGKSMIAKAMAQILPATPLDDVIILPNVKDQNVPHVRTLPAGEGRSLSLHAQQRAKRLTRLFTGIEVLLALAILSAGFYALYSIGGTGGITTLVLCILVTLFFLFVARQFGAKPGKLVPNLIIERPAGVSPAPYVDGTGAHAGALLGDVRHDPFQSGGLETPTHLRVEPGAIHRANKGLLFIDEINVLRLDSQQALLTAMQDRKYSITGQSEKSSGAQAKTEPIPCDFILVAAGNMDVLNPTDSRFQGLHPALRSRIRGYGYEVYVRAVMEDTDANRRKLVRFVAQEVRRDGRIPHFDGGAVAEVIREAQRRSGHTGKLTLRLRELGGLVRTAGDIARDENATSVTVDHVLGAKRMSQSLEYQVTRRGIEVATAKEALTVGGEKVGTAIGCAFMGTGETGEPAGIVVPVEADATISSDRQKGTLFFGGGLERDATVADTVGAVVKRLRGSDMAGIDLHVQSLLQQAGADVQALSAASAVACISALEDLPVRQDTVILGSLAVTGRLRAVEGITQMVEGAADLGYRRAVVPHSNKDDILLEHSYRSRIEILLAEDLAEVLDHALAPGAAKRKVQVQNALHRKVHART